MLSKAAADFEQQKHFDCVNRSKERRPVGMQLSVLHVGGNAEIVCMEELA